MTVTVNHCPACLADNMAYIFVPLHVFKVQLNSWRGGALPHSQVTKGIEGLPCTAEGKVYCLAPSAQDVFERFGSCAIKSVTWLGPGYDWHVDHEARRKAEEEEGEALGMAIQEGGIDIEARRRERGGMNVFKVRFEKICLRNGIAPINHTQKGEVLILAESPTAIYKHYGSFTIISIKRLGKAITLEPKG